jgi:hypothetical protein
MDESDLQSEKHDEPRITTQLGIVMFEELEKLRVSL